MLKKIISLILIIRNKLFDKCIHKKNNTSNDKKLYNNLECKINKEKINLQLIDLNLIKLIKLI